MLLKTIRYIARNFSSFPGNRITVSEEVQAALNATKGVVALESTVITHGLPRPHNLLLARRLEETVRQHDAVPATIALLDGTVHIGLSDEQLQRVAEDANSVKVSKRDIPLTLVNNLIGGTTVAATMYLANMVGIRVFATGGLGGVHRGASETFDISADLLELGKTPVVVVCAGVKSILDIPKTLEFLETNSVNVVVFGENNKFPGFFTPETECRAPFHTKSLHDIVSVVDCSRSIGLRSGCVVACPIPAKHAAHGDIIEKAIQEALHESLELKITSKNVTPFILKRVSELTRGASLKTNMALLENNAAIGAQLAKLFADKVRGKPQSKIHSETNIEEAEPIRCPKIVVFGATILDFETITDCDVKRAPYLLRFGMDVELSISCSTNENAAWYYLNCSFSFLSATDLIFCTAEPCGNLNDGGSYVGKVIHRCGGVGRNHADALTRLGNDVKFISAVGNDLFGDYFKKECAHMNLEHVVTVNDVPTAVYMSCNVKGNVLYGVSAIGNIIERITPDLVKAQEKLISEADYVVLDGNIPVHTIKKVVEMAHFHKVKTWFEPTDIAKMRKIFDAGVADLVNITSPNRYEFVSFCSCIGLKLPADFATNWELERIFEMISAKPSLYLQSLDTLIITLGPQGTIVLSREGNETRQFQLASPVSPSKVVSVSGAGDCFNSGFLTGTLRDMSTERCLMLAQKCAAINLSSIHAVPEALTTLKLSS